MASISDILSCFPATIQAPSSSLEQPKSWWMQDKLLSGAPACHFGLPSRLLGHSAWSTASSTFSSCSSSASSSGSISPISTPGATLATLVGLNRRLDSPSPPGTHSRLFTRLLQRPSLPSEGSLSCKPSSQSPSPSPVRLPWYFPASKPPVAKNVTKKDVRDAFLRQPNLHSPRHFPTLGLGLASQLSPPPSVMVAKRLLHGSPFIVPLPDVGLSRPSSTCSSASSGSASSSAYGPLLPFPSFGNAAVWSPRAAYAPDWPSPWEVATSFARSYKSQAGAPCDSDNVLGLLHVEQNVRDAPLSSAYPGPPPGLPLPHTPSLARLSLGPGVPSLAFSAVEIIEDVTLCSPSACSSPASPSTLQAPSLAHAGISFTLTRMLGAGASAHVFGATHDATGQRCAVKVIHKGAAAAAGFTRGEYLRELDVFRRIAASPEPDREKCEGLSMLRMAWEDVARDRIFFVMDLYPTDLFSVLASGAPITSRDRQLYCQELIGAVAALRGLGIVHGDIKPSNVLISARGRAVLSDFGNASLVSPSASSFSSSSSASSSASSALTSSADSGLAYESWRSHTLSGTPPYMAPELLAADMAEQGYGAAADVWSLGLVFLEVFSPHAGAHFNGWTIDEVRAEHAKLERQGVDLGEVEMVEMPRGGFGIMLDAMLQYYEELRPSVQELAEWSARAASWEVAPGSAHDWTPLPEPRSWDPQDSSAIADFLAFDGPASAALKGAEGPEEFEYRAPGAFA